MKTANRTLRIAVALLLGAGCGAALGGQSKDSKKDPEQIGARDVGKGVNFYSLEKELALGKQLAQEIERQAKLVEDPAPAEFINRLAQNLARNSDLKVPLTAKMIDSGEVNAFALPGGFLYVNAGLVMKAETEAELAGPIAHEIAHVAARHGTRQVSRGHIANIASISLIFVGGWPGYAARQGMGLALPLGFLKFSRGFEREADLLGVQYMYKAGYDPSAFVDFFEKMAALEKKKPGTLGELFRSHPNTESRIKATQNTIQDLLNRQPQYLVSTSEFGEIQRRLAMRLGRRNAAPENTGPTLRRSPSGSREPVDDPDRPADPDERPKLKRRQQ